MSTTEDIRNFVEKRPNPPEAPKLKKRLSKKQRRRLGITCSVVCGLVLAGTAYQVHLNRQIDQTITSSYKNKKQAVLVKNVPYQKIARLKRSAPILISPQRSDKLDALDQLYRQTSKQKALLDHIESMSDGHGYYADGVTKKDLTKTYQRLLSVRNQTTYTTYRDRLDQVQMQFDATQEATDYIQKTYKKHQSKKDVSSNEVLRSTAYLSLIKNHQTYIYWRPKVKSVEKAFNKRVDQQDQSTKKKQDKALTRLKLDPLEGKYTPSKIDIATTDNWLPRSVVAKIDPKGAELLGLDYTGAYSPEKAPTKVLVLLKGAADTETMAQVNAHKSTDPDDFSGSVPDHNAKLLYFTKSSDGIWTRKWLLDAKLSEDLGLSETPIQWVYSDTINTSGLLVADANSTYFGQFIPKSQLSKKASSYDDDSADYELEAEYDLSKYTTQPLNALSTKLSDLKIGSYIPSDSTKQKSLVFKSSGALVYVTANDEDKASIRVTKGALAKLDTVVSKAMGDIFLIDH